MTATSNARALFTKKHGTYANFIGFVGYPSGIRRFFAQSPLIQSGLRVLDAGCGTGVVALALYDALRERRAAVGTLHAFDLTPAMLERFSDTLVRRGIGAIETTQADVLAMHALPASWTAYDLIVSASMLEYLPRSRFVEALGALRARLADHGRMVVFITKRNWLTRPMIGRWWQSNLYDKEELLEAFRLAGFSGVMLSVFPLAARYLALWGYVIEAAK